MKYSLTLAVFVAFVGTISCGPTDKYAKILKNDVEIYPDGTYNYEYKTDNGIGAQESGYPRNLGGNPPEVAETVQGTFYWTSPEGQFISLGYSADENGYHPVGDALPTPPPIPDYILRSIEYIKSKSQNQQGFKRF